MADILELSTRKFVRQFRQAKAAASAGRKIIVVDGPLRFNFYLVQPCRPLCGLARGRLKTMGKAESLFSTGEKWEADK